MKLNVLSVGEYLFLLILVATLVTISSFNYLLFHSLIEIVILSMGFLTFAFTWHLRRFELGYLLIVGILLGLGAFINVFHLLAYKGMGVFTHGEDFATELWIVSRYQLAFYLVFASLFQHKKFDPRILLSLMTMTTLLLLFWVVSGTFPDCFIEGMGPTRFKITSEYIISFFLGISMWLFWRNCRSSFSSQVNTLIMIFFVLSLLTELIFTSYLGVYDLFNMTGHIFLVIASFMLYKAIVETGLKNPFEVLFKNLNDAVKSRDEFISLASHELKTPLTPLKLQLQMFQREIQKNGSHEISQEKLSKLIQGTDFQLDRLNQLIDGMLDVSRLSSGHFELFRKKVDLSQLIEEIVLKHRPQIDAVKSRLELKLISLKAEIDAMRIEQVISNILLNALKYAPGCTMEIGLEKTSDEKIKIWISDTGPGITKEYKERIFDRFERAAPSLSTGGLGLGLYISRQIIESHGGSLAVESEVNKGSKFIIML